MTKNLNNNHLELEKGFILGEDEMFIDHNVLESLS